ncbi:MAG: 2-amino-4-hydroxy-6-hydroxymethyldihydropteridine diphosphokinase [Bacteroidales bacterium]
MFEKAYLLLGSNRGNRIEMLAKARDLIDEQIGSIIKSSSVYETAPWGFDDKISFLNQVICIETLYDPFCLLDQLLQIESYIGRIRTSKNYSSRNIDIDILFFNDYVINDQHLVIPHPRLHLRKFTLIPMAEIAGEHIHPLFNRSIEALLDECSDTKEVKLFVPEKTS